MTSGFQTLSPIDNSIVFESSLADEQAILAALTKARQAQKSWQQTSIAERANICRRFVEDFVSKQQDIALEITLQMGRPIRYTPGEVNGLAERANYMIDIAEQALAPLQINDKPGFKRYIERVALGTVFVIAPWNYPYLTAVNAIIPAIMAGNTVLMKPSSQTPLCAKRFAESFANSGLPEGVFQYLFLSHADTEKMIRDEDIDFVAFTGSVGGGRHVQQAASSRFIGLGLELGGKDPAYVRQDADLPIAVENLVDGAFFNSGQSCCGIERIYVHQSLHQEFVEHFVELVKQYQLGDPREQDTTLGPMVRTSAANFVREQALEAISQGATPHITEADFSFSKENTTYLAPQVLTNVNHSMRLMTEESFGPVIGIMAVTSDEEAISLMNDSDFGLTASVWTKDQDAAINIGNQVETGTWFMNRCDYLDPALAWTGVKDSGRGCTLSAMGYEQLTRPMSYHLKIGN